MDGRKEEFNKQKIVIACMKAGTPKKIALKIANRIARKVKEGTTTREIRAWVLKMLEKENPQWRDNWEFWDRIVKGRVTVEHHKFVEIKKGNLYLGREVRDVGKPGLDSVKEVKAIINELKEDLKFGIPKKKINARTYVLFMAVLHSKKMSKAEKKKAIREINKFRKSLGWKEFKLKKPL